MKTLYIVDAVNFLFRSYHAIGQMTNARGESTNALYGLIRSLFKIIHDFTPDYLVAVFDGPDNKRSRTEIYSEYKSHRAGMPEDLFPQWEKSIEFCNLAGIANLSIPGIEADDAMGSIARWAEKNGIEVFICTSDKDLCQLVTPYISLINPHKNNLLITPKVVEELFGVTPVQMVDLLAIAGDASDNIPGLEGFGLKTAATLLQQWGTLDQILAHPEKIPGAKKQETIKKDKEIALLSRKLATIQTDIAIPTEKDFYHVKQPDLPKLLEFYRDMNFLSFLKEQNKEIPLSENAEEIAYTIVENEEELRKLVHKLSKEKTLCIDTETTAIRPMQARLVGLGIGYLPRLAWYIPMNGDLPRETALQILKPLLENPQIGFYGHNIKYDLHILLNEEIAVKKISFDTMIASYLLNPQNQRHNLDHLCLEKFHKVKTPIEQLLGKGKNQRSMLEVSLTDVTAYCCEDVDYTCRLKDLFVSELKKEELWDLFENIELPLLPVLIAMERNGIYLDKAKLAKMSEQLSHDLHILQNTIYELAAEKFNINSTQQLSFILFHKLGIKPGKKTTTGYSTSADVLESLRQESPIIEKILEYRTLEKLRSTYVDTLPAQILPETQRIHCTFTQSVAATGRLACQDPNLQNIPIRSKIGRKIREAFEPQKLEWSFVSLDYSQIELRLLAHLSEDPVLLKAFHSGEDIHVYTAALVFNVPSSEVTSEMRATAKAVNFGIVYGQQPFGLSQVLGIEYKTAVDFIETYFKRYTRVKEFIEFCKESTRKTGYAHTLTGRRRPLPEIHSKNPQIRAGAERLAINTPLQGSNADIIKLAMIRIDALFQRNKELAMMLLQIHDELLFEVPDEDIPRLSKEIQQIMENVFPLKVPLEVDIAIGKNWGECYY